jgi:hypothetical protein
VGGGERGGRGGGGEGGREGGLEVENDEVASHFFHRAEGIRDKLRVPRREEGKEGGREEEKEGGREEGKEGGREGGREGGKEGRGERRWIVTERARRLWDLPTLPPTHPPFLPPSPRRRRLSPDEERRP